MTVKGPIVPFLCIDEIARRYEIEAQEVQKVLDRAHLAMKPLCKTVTVTEGDNEIEIQVTRIGIGPIDNPHGEFWMYGFILNDQWEKYSVLVKCDTLDDNLMPVFRNKEELVMRTDSGCETGQMFHDLTCECREQLDMATEAIAKAGEGLIINIPRQDGRGKGLPFKLATLLLQRELGINTVESASMLAKKGDIDVRTYAGVVAILKFFEIPTNTLISLATNNPYKSHVFLANGYDLHSFRPMIVPATDRTRRHLAAKHDCLGHNGIGT